MSEKQFEKLLKIKQKKIDDSIQAIEEADKRFNEKMNKILNAI